MKHIEKDQWIRYVHDKLPEEARRLYDEHLYDCDECLELYLHIIESTDSLPEISAAKPLAEAIMAQLSRLPEQEAVPSGVRAFGDQGDRGGYVNENQRQQPFYKQTVFHYFFAAAMTMLLVSSGVFQSLANYVENIQQEIFSCKDSSITSQLLERAFSEKTIRKKEAE
ncbi:hypothetical protein SAMN05421736_101946 [Evansella caseinilytica]|uniref:Uncharacterized protein n=1 Tax=Evansella caseinilytica TaxID=1503961 RepID=A0A1H3IW74_9BACI|nr:hypothetical protein [Evansella caseinilytica]SDY31951.1 hypothetical protein SAMN05421736_101946 [Evansella caseinilytica]